MALVDNAFYVDSAGYTAVTAWATGTVIAAGALRRPTAAAVGSERVVVCVVAGTTHATTEPTWTTTRGAKNTDNTVTWQECTGIAALNGDATNTPSWTITATPPGGVKNTAVTLGQVIKRDNGASYQICTTAGTAGNGVEPSFSDTAGVTTADNTVTWTSLGAVGNFTGNQAPHARLASAIANTWAQAGNTLYIKSSHAETQATTITLLGASTTAITQRWLCHGGGAYPPTSTTTGATLTVTGGSTVVQINSLGLYCEGVEFIANANGAVIQVGNTAVGYRQTFKNGKFTLANNSATSTMTFGGTGYGRQTLDNVQVSFANASQKMFVYLGDFEWRNTPSALQGAAVPGTLINSAASSSHVRALIDGVDFSAAGSGKTIVVASQSFNGRMQFMNCKTGASVTKSETPGLKSFHVDFVNCDSGANNYVTESYRYEGTLTTEIGIVRTGGASDGTTPIAWKVVTNANAKFTEPFECPPIAVWNEDTSSKTLTIQGIWGGGAVPNDDDIWVEVEYLGDASFPISSVISDAKASVLATAAGQSASSETWGGSTTDFNLSVTFTPAMKGFIYARVKCGKLSSTFYIDPKITLT